MDENVTLVFHGFLNLKVKEKMKLVELMNHYFDSLNRENLRQEYEKNFSELDLTNITCKCCGK